MVRNRFHHASWLVLAAVGVSMACSSSSSEGSGTADGACATYVAAARDAAKQCGRLDISPAEESDYLARAQQYCERMVNAPGSGITPAMIEQCATEMRNECGDDDACEDVLGTVRGSLAGGSPCDLDTQCASGQCRTHGDDSAICGTCAPSVGIGEPCPEGGCVAGAVCGGSGTPAVCVALRTAGEGEACGSLATEAVRCANGLYCRQDGASGSTGTCTVPAGEGAPCGNTESGYTRCKAPLTCVNDRCGRLLEAGAACKESNDCGNGLACDRTTKRCATIAWGGPGAVCDDDVRRCESGFCARTGMSTDGTGTCVAYLANGQPCDPGRSIDQRCDVYSMCLDGTCQAYDPALCK